MDNKKGKNMLRINETPVRTSKSFNINDININETEIENESNVFENVEIIGDSSKIQISNNKTPINLKYGLGEELTNQVKNNSNQEFQIVVDSKTNKETIFNFDFNKTNSSLIENIDILANEGTSATFVFKYESLKDVEAYHNGIIKLNAKENSNINIIIINLLSDNSKNLLAIENTIEKNANVTYTIVDFGGEKTVTNYYSNVAGDFAKSNLNTIYLGKDKQVLDLNYIAELYGEKSNVNIEVQGALKDKARKNFKGTIDFKKGCKKAVGEENENCMLLSDTAKSIALPMLLCSEEDVEGAHSSSAGKIGEKELFYIMSRGFELKEAQKLLVRANFNKILENISNEDLKNLILKNIDLKLD
ncbi:MAG: SufD family Fe-S cluster assembly protein [Clostridia bacterium]|nr:SufD family Fe-S cluster assembly protein [Clostridia bacterium]